MGFPPLLRVALALAVSAAWGFPWHGSDQDQDLRRNVTPSASLLPPTNSSSTTAPTGTSTSTASDLSDAPDTTISATGECSGSVTWHGWKPPHFITTTITQNVTVGPSITAPPPAFITPFQPCETIIKPRPSCPTSSTCMNPPKMPQMSSIIQITKKTTVYEAPTMTDPPSFDTHSPTPEHQNPTTDDPPDPPASIDQIISDIFGRVHGPSPGPGSAPTENPKGPGSPDGPQKTETSKKPGDRKTPDDPGGPENPEDTDDPSPAEPQQRPAPSTITSPPDAKSTVTLADIPITVVNQTIVAIGTHTMTITRNQNTNTKPNTGTHNMGNILGPTTTLTVSGASFTVAPPVIIGPSTTFVINPSLLTSPSSGPVPTWEPGDGDDQGDDSSSGNVGHVKPVTTSSSEGSAHRTPRELSDLPNVGTLVFTVVTVMTMAGVWVLV